MTTCNHPGPTCTCRKDREARLIASIQADISTQPARDRAAIERVEDYHSPEEVNRAWREGCGNDWPCATIEAIWGGEDR